ncbi:MAG TPA: hypothetical protein DCY38_03290, partial [Opitutae bacterium]|nr:hypothetical protein [Opitutae bacterium]
LLKIQKTGPHQGFLREGLPVFGVVKAGCFVSSFEWCWLSHRAYDYLLLLIMAHFPSFTNTYFTS